MFKKRNYLNLSILIITLLIPILMIMIDFSCVVTDFSSDSKTEELKNEPPTFEGGGSISTDEYNEISPKSIISQNIRYFFYSSDNPTLINHQTGYDIYKADYSVDNSLSNLTNISKLLMDAGAPEKDEKYFALLDRNGMLFLYYTVSPTNSVYSAVIQNNKISNIYFLGEIQGQISGCYVENNLSHLIVVNNGLIANYVEDNSSGNLSYKLEKYTNLNETNGPGSFAWGNSVLNNVYPKYILFSRKSSAGDDDILMSPLDDLKYFQKMDSFNSGQNDITPFVDEEKKVYISTNRDGSYDIYRWNITRLYDENNYEKPSNELPMGVFSNVSNGDCIDISAAGSVFITGSASDDVAVSSVSVFVDNIQIASVGTSYWVTPTFSLIAGIHSAHVIVFDNVGSSFSPQPINVYVGCNSPSLSISSPFNGFCTNSTNITISGTASDDLMLSTIVAKIDSVVIPFSGSINSFSFASPNLSYGSHVLDISAYDILGSSANQSINFQLGGCSPLSANFVVPAQGANIYSVPFMVKGTAYSSMMISSIDLRIDGTIIPVSPTTDWDAPSTFLSNNIHTISMQAFDTIGSSTALLVHSINVSCTSPLAGLTLPVDGSCIGTNYFTVSGTAFDTGLLASINIYIDGTYFSVNPTTDWSGTSAYVNQGIHSLSLVVFDDMSSNSTPITISINVGCGRPSGSIIEPIGTCYSATPTMIYGTAAASGTSSITSVDVKIDGVTTTSSGTINWSATSYTLSNGYHSCSLVVWDSGTCSLPYVTNFVIDASFPTLGIFTPTNGGCYNSYMIPFAGTFQDLGGPVIGVEIIDSSSFTPINAILGTNTWGANLTFTTDGNYTLEITPYDMCGLATPHTINITIDTSGPIVNIIQPTSGQISSTNVIDIFGSVDGTSIIEISIDGAGWTSIGQWYPSWNYQQPLTSGPHSIMARGIDSCGNISSTVSTVTFTVAGSSVGGSPLYWFGGGNDGTSVGIPPVASTNDYRGFLNTYSVALDSLGNFYIGDPGNNRVCKWDSTFIAHGCIGNGVTGWNYTGTNIGGSSLTELNIPCGIEVDASGTMYIADEGNHRIVRWNSLNASAIDWIGGGTNSWQSGSGAISGYDTQSFQNPRYLSLDGSNNIYVSEAGNNRISRWNILNGSGSGWIGGGYTGWQQLSVQCSFSSDYNFFWSNMGIDVCDDGFIYVAEQSSTRISRWYLPDGSCSGWIGGTSGWHTTTTTFSDAESSFNMPTDVKVDSLYNIYVADNSNHRISKWDTSGNYHGWIGNGMGGWHNGNGASSLSSLAGFSYPYGIFVDNSNIYVGDSANFRISIWQK